jgi:twinkle protein
MQIYEDGGAKCYSCGKSFHHSKVEKENMTSPRGFKVPKKRGPLDPEDFAKAKTEVVKATPKVSCDEIEEFGVRGFKDRLVKKATNEFYGVKVGYDSNGQIDSHYYPYGNDKKRGYKIRELPKTFSFVGTFGGLFGREKFSAGGKRLIITEGEVDALSVAQASFDRYNKYYPVVSLPSSSCSSVLMEEREWIRSFQEVVLWMDNDEAGITARDKAIKIIGADKVKVVEIAENDASDVLTSGEDGSKRIMEAIWDAQMFKPAGIIGQTELWDALVNYNEIKAIPYPECLTGINSKIKGARLGEIALFISGTGSGKSTIVREIGLEFLRATEDKIGIISLEESPGETARLFSGMAIHRNPAEEEIPLDELKVGFDSVFGEDRVVVLDHQGSIKDDSILDQFEYMCLSGCKYLFVDHITILVSEGADGLTGNEAIDKIMNDLLRLAKRHTVWIGLISHLRKAETGRKSFEEGRLPSIDDIRGSGSIKQVSFDIIAFARNMTARQERVRNRIEMAILKSRTTGKTGPVLGADYNVKTGRLVAAPPDLEDDEEAFGEEKTETVVYEEALSEEDLINKFKRDK